MFCTFSESFLKLLPVLCGFVCVGLFYAGSLWSFLFSLFEYNFRFLEDLLFDSNI